MLTHNIDDAFELGLDSMISDKARLKPACSAKGLTQKMIFCLSDFCLFDLILYVRSTIFQLNRDESSWVEPVLSLGKCVLLKDHNAVTPARLEPAAPRSRIKHSTTEPMRSHILLVAGERYANNKGVDQIARMH